MSQFLFITEIPPNQSAASAPGYTHKWIQFENGASSILKPLRAYTRHQRNAWLLPAENAWPYLLDMSNLAVKSDLSYSILLIAGEVTPMTTPFKLP